MAGVGDFFSGLGGNFSNAILSSSKAFFYGLIGLIVVGIVGYFAWKWYRNAAFFKTPVSLTIVFDNGITKTRYDLRGGVFWNKGIKDFKIKIPKAKDHILGYIPDFSKADGDGRIHFTTTGDRTVWWQCESRWITKKDAKENEWPYYLEMKPVPREDKQLTINSIKNWRDTISKEKLTIAGIMVGGFIIMVIAHLISLYIQTKIKCGTP